ncbi:TPA: hypothetical protein ACH3X1_007720 [Trebouxia sp. C0004]
MAMQAQISQQLTCGRNRLRSPGPQASFHCIKQRGDKPSLNFSVAALSPSLQQRCDEWLALDRDPSTVSEAIQAIDTDNEALLQDCLGQRLAFGTAGLRGIMGFGFNRMNQVVVQQTTQGFCNYLREQAGPKLASQGVTIGFDGRHHSKEFAHLAAAVFVSQNVPVHLFSEVVPTPFVAGAVTYKGCAGGIMITASHNPKQYNGYKVYWGNGCQIIPPHDVGIAAAINSQTELWDLPSDVTSSELVKDPLHMVTQRYYYALQQDLSFRPRQDNPKAAPVVYTPLHGVGLPWVQKAFTSFNLPPPIPVVEQALPDPDFPTLTFPNPEEGPGVLDLAFATAKAHGARLVLANDPDADRFAAAEQHPNTGAWRIFSGNEIGILLAHWLWCCWRRDHMDDDPACVVMLASAVSSKMLQAMAQEERFKFDETLTGFKWLGHRALELQQAGFTPLFAFEEAIGFMFGGAPGSIKDKDGVAAAAVFAEMAADLNHWGISVAQHLQSLRDLYGYFETRSSYFTSDRPADIRAVFQRLRHEGNYPKALAGVEITAVRDLDSGLDTAQAEGRSRLPWQKGDLMLTFTLDNVHTLTLRASGTEPKLKYYLEVFDEDDAATAINLADKLEDAIATELVLPEKHGLIPKHNNLIQAETE